MTSIEASAERMLIAASIPGTNIPGWVPSYGCPGLPAGGQVMGRVQTTNMNLCRSSPRALGTYNQSYGIRGDSA